MIDLEPFWVDFGAKLGPKIDQKSIPEGIEKAMQKHKAHGRAKNRKTGPLHPATSLVQTPGEGGSKPLPGEVLGFLEWKF